MKLYQTKKRWKWLLFIAASIIFLFFIFYSNNLIKSIAKEERRKVAVWADAITYRAELVSHTDAFFEKIRTEEGKRATLLAKAIQKVNEAPLYADITFYLDIITSNSTIPSIIVLPDGRIDCAVNVDPEISNLKYISELGDEIKKFDSIIVTYNKKKYSIVYYEESQIYSNLRVMLDNLVESFFQEVVINDASVPVIITDSSMEKVLTSGHIDSTIIADSIRCAELIADMKTANPPINIDLPNQGRCYVLHEESSVLKRLRYYPFIQVFIVFAFAIIAYMMFSMSRRAEQNQVWVGMSKETAHQLGTPISSLLAWGELLKEQNVDPVIMQEIDKDLNRLETIAQRFSKIGSVPELTKENVVLVIDDFVSYLQTRISSKVNIIVNHNGIEQKLIPINRYLFEWVIENICKNSVDAMNGQGVIVIDLSEDEKYLHVDIADTGKGIPAKYTKTVFKPGYTSKKRGWGLGLSLAQRIIKEYHKGKLFVKSSILDRGTVMRISLLK